METEIKRGMNSLDAPKSAGPHGIPNSLVKSCSFYFVKALTFLFNEPLQLQHGPFPVPWKLSRISPVHKKGSKNVATENYRRVAILSAVPKPFESLVNDHHNDHCTREYKRSRKVSSYISMWIHDSYYRTDAARLPSWSHLYRHVNLESWTIALRFFNE